ncbi:MAG: 30S ribosomal protein S8 [candidate division Zixibacteria bacterium RBG_16_40_9]|nr:MAG: 30S ribosomal protein S8 [candidate division Zixibacteria bacterium RBG_16_40_9]
MSAINDPISDMLLRIRNASKARHKKVDIPSSKMKKRIAEILQEHRFVASFLEVPNNRQNMLRIFLRYPVGKKSAISGLRRISKPGLRIYVDQEDLKRINQNLGVTIISTSQGVLANKQAWEKKIGGEAICQVW